MPWGCVEYSGPVSSSPPRRDVCCWRCYIGIKCKSVFFLRRIAIFFQVSFYYYIYTDNDVTSELTAGSSCFYFRGITTIFSHFFRRVTNFSRFLLLSYICIANGVPFKCTERKICCFHKANNIYFSTFTLIYIANDFTSELNAGKWTWNFFGRITTIFHAR